MKKESLPILLVIILTGCAGLPFGQERPHYDPEQRQINAPGFPVEMIPLPDGYNFKRSVSNESRREYESGSGDSGIVFDEFIFESSDPAATAGITFQSVDINSRWLSLSRLGRFDFVGGKRVYHRFEYGGSEYAPLGTYVFMVSPLNCVMAVDLGIVSRDERRKFTARLVEAANCQDITPSPSQAHKDAMLQRAYQVFNIK